MFDQGKTEAQIAKALKHDPRTIARGIEEAIKDRRLTHAEDDLLRTALQKHQNQLTDVLDDIDSILVMPSYNLVLREEKDGILARVQLAGASIRPISEEFMVVEITKENELVWELFREHLKQDHIWDSLKQWRSALQDYIRSIWHFKQAIKTKLEETTGLKYIKRQDDNVSEYLLPEGTDLIYEVKIKIILGIPDATDLENNMITGDDNFIRHGPGGTKFAYCSNKAECRDKIASVSTSLPSTSEASKVRISYQQLVGITGKMKREVEEIKLLNMVPGKCRVCRRLGL